MKKAVPAMNEGRISSWKCRCDETAFYRPTWAEINTTAFNHNLSFIKSRLHSKTKILAVVKANAYGHMVVPIARLAEKAGVAMLGVASIEEGIYLREHGIKMPILILGSIYPLDNLAVVVKHNLIPSISSAQGVIELMRLGSRLKKTLQFHLKVDTGMGRIGILPQSALTLLKKIAGRREISMSGMYTHFSEADSDPAYTRLQFSKFMEVVKTARKLGINFTAHCANSAALLKYPEMQLDMVRPGIALYGLSPWQKIDKKIDLSPVLTWKSAVVYLKNVNKGTPISYGRTFTARKPMTVATLPVGYADGYPRSLSNRSEVLIRGRKCRVLGRVTMDMMIVDVTRVPNPAIGDEVVLVGTQGKERIRVEDLAAIAGTISYEITCGISHRVPRIETK